MPPLVKVCVLGSTGVGKSKLIQQFVQNYYDDQYEPTPSKGNIVHCSTMLNGNLYQLKILDMPAIKELPSDPSAEWSQYQHCLLRTAHAYILIFDLNTPVTFHYVKLLRDQLFESRNMQNVPVWIVGNKADLCLNVLATMRTHRHDHHHHHHHHPHLPHLHHHHHHNNHHLPSPPRSLFHPTHQHHADSPYEDLTPACKEFANLVRKQWKCNYIECSAKYNWRVVPIFREIMKNLDPSIISQATEMALSASPTAISGGGPLLPTTPPPASLSSAKDHQHHQRDNIIIIMPSAIKQAATTNDTSGGGGSRPRFGPAATSSRRQRPPPNDSSHSNRICHIS